MKMIYVLMITLSMSSLNYSQVLLEDLDNPQSNVKLYALKIIIDKNLVEFIPGIQIRLFEQPTLHMQFAFLDALAKLQDSEIEQWTLSFIENADNFQYPEDPLFYKVYGTEILFSIGNYSSVEYVFDLLNRDQNFVDPICLNLLKEIVLNLSQWNPEATAELVRIFNNLNIDNSIRYSSLRILYETNYNDILNLSVSAVLGDANPEIRFYANGILNESNYPGLHDLYVQQLSVEPEAYIRSTYATSLLILFGEPSDLNLVIEYQPGEPDHISRDFVAAAIENFIPPKPDGLGYYDLATRLISYTEEMFQNGWIENEETRDYYIQQLTTVYESIEETGEIGEACLIIDERILQQLEQDLAENIITTEAYKFLYYYTNYIKEEIEKEFGPCP
jgi:hypothetical protein